MKQKLKRYELNYKQAFGFVEESIKDTNHLSNAVVSFLKFHSGRFFTLLPEGIPLEKVHEFDFGGKSECLRDEIVLFIKASLNSSNNLSCIFDDFDADFKENESNDLYRSNGLHYNNEVYYAISKNPNQELIAKCLQYSNAIWHSICVITKLSFNDLENKTLTDSKIALICENSVLILVGAYDAESYIFWEKINASSLN